MSEIASPPVVWSQEWAYEKAAQAIHYLARHEKLCLTSEGEGDI